MHLPKHIALVGWPESGKDSVAGFLNEVGDYFVIDDSLCLRLAAPYLFSFDTRLPYNQEGKSTVVETMEGPKEVRYLLGRLGDAMEEMFGTGFTPFQAMARAKRMSENLNGPQKFVYPSVRKDQAKYYQNEGGICIEVSRPMHQPSKYAFDAWPEELVNLKIVNDGTLQQLYYAISDLVDRRFKVEGNVVHASRFPEQPQE